MNRYTVTEHDGERFAVVDTQTRREVIHYDYDDTGERFDQSMNARRECARLNQEVNK